MGTGYTRNDTSNNIADGNIINASDLDGEFDAVEAAFNSSTGHAHDGTSAEGAPVTVLGPSQDFVATTTEIKPKTTNTLDIGTNSLQYKNIYIDGSAYIDEFGESTLFSTTNRVQFRDTGIYIYSSADGQLDAVADVEIQLAAPTVTITGSTIISDSSSSNALRITQTGAGNALVVEDSANPDSTPFVVNASGNVGIGTSSPSVELEIASSAPQMRITDTDTNAVFQINASSTSGGVELQADATDVGSNPFMAFDVGGSEKIRILDGGNVGIGTSSPSQLLEVRGAAAKIRITDSDTSGTTGIEFVDSADVVDAEIEVGNSTQYFAIKTAASERMRIDSSGNVGIGTADPRAKLHTYYNTADDTFTNLVSSFSPNIVLEDLSTSAVDFQFLVDADALQFRHGDASTDTKLTSEAMRIDSSGNVGIGTSSPSARLNVVDATSQDAMRITQTGTGNALVIEDSANPDSTPFVVDASGKTLVGLTTAQTTAIGSAAVQIAGGTAPLSFLREADSSTAINLEFSKSRASGAILASGDTIGRLYFSGSDGTAKIPAAFIDAAVDGTPGTNDMPGRLVFSTTADGASSPTERMRIDSSGNVGINTTSPDTLFTVKGQTVIGATVAESANLANLISGTPPQLIAGWSVPAITWTPSVSTEAVFTRDGDMAITILASNTDNAQIKFADNDSETAGQIDYDHADNSLAIDVNGSEAMRIDSSGDVGIGTISPSAKLDVVGDTNSRVFEVSATIDDSDQATSTVNIDVNNTSNNTQTSNTSPTGMSIDYDSTDTASTSGFLYTQRAFEVDSYISRTGDGTDSLYGVYSQATAGLTDGADSISSLFAVTGIARADAAFGSTVGILYGVNGRVYHEGDSAPTTTYGGLFESRVFSTAAAADISVAYGSRAQTNIDSGTIVGITTAYGVYSSIAHNSTEVSSVITNGYLYRGDYAGSGTVTTKWGMYITDEDKNYFSGNVGIGTTSPSEKLTVIGNAVIGDTTTKYNTITINGGHVGDGGNDYGLTIYSFEPAITLVDRTGGSGSGQLRVHSNGAFWLLGDTTNNGTIGHDSNTTDFVMAKFEPDFHAFYVDSGATEAMRIDGNGNVGIGTVSPGRTLDIQTESGDADARIYAKGTGSGDDAILYLSIAGTSATTRVNFGDADDADRGRIIYGHSSDYMSFTTAASEAMRIDGSGNVGIGTGSVDTFTKLQVVESSTSRSWSSSAGFSTLLVERNGNTGITLSSAATSSGYLNFASPTDENAGIIQYDHSANAMTFRTNGSGENMRINNSGNVGIGATNPAVPLHIERNNTEMLRLHNKNAGGGSGYISFYETGGTRTGYIGNSTAANTNFHIYNQSAGGAVIISTNATERMRITSSGVVTVNEGSVVLNGSTISAVQVTVADDAVAALTFTNRRFGMLNLVEGADDDAFSATSELFLGYVDFGGNPTSQTAMIGANTVIDDTNTLTGTTGADGKLTIGTAGTSGTLYLENRRGGTRTYNITLL
jgi:hypothetical protein